MALLVLIAGSILVATTGRNFFSPGNISDILTGTSVLGFIAIGQTLVILVGSLDLSVPYVTSLASLIGAGVMASRPGNVLPPWLSHSGSSAAIGLANGLIVAGLKVHGFIATLGMGLIISGYLATNFKGSFGQTPLSFRLIGATGLGPVPISTLIMLACAALVLLMLHRTRHRPPHLCGGRRPGRGPAVRHPGPWRRDHRPRRSARSWPAWRAVAGQQAGRRQPNGGSQGGYDLLSIAAVVLGGTLLAGGKGSWSARWAGC